MQLQSSINITKDANSCVPSDAIHQKSNHIALGEIGKSRGKLLQNKSPYLRKIRL